VILREDVSLEEDEKTRRRKVFVVWEA
jgi:hypothetical protein